MSAKPEDHVVVIGGGVIGAMCAWQLVKAGLRVTVVEAQQFGSGCSHGNCGYIVPSHVLPLPRPGAIASTLKTMLRPNSPFSVKPRFSRDSISWFWNFSRRCNHKDMMATGSALHALLQSSKSLYLELVEQDRIDCQWQSQGLLFVYDTKEAFQAFSETNELLREHFHVEATPYDSQQLVELEPALKPGLGGGWHYEGDCHLRPDKLMSAMREYLQSHRAAIVEQFSVDGFHVEGNSAKSVSGGGQEIAADHFVVATGALTPFLNKHLGCRIPIEPGKGYSLTMPSPKRMPQIPIIFEHTHVAITPLVDKYRIGSTMEFAGYDTSISRKRLNLLRASAEKYLHDPYCDPIEEEWYGWRPMTWDGKPIIGRSPAMRNVWIAAGHNMLGLSLAPSTGKLLTEMMTGQTPHLDPTPFAIERFLK